MTLKELASVVHTWSVVRIDDDITRETLGSVDMAKSMSYMEWEKLVKKYGDRKVIDISVGRVQYENGYPQEFCDLHIAIESEE